MQTLTPQKGQPWPGCLPAQQLHPAHRRRQPAGRCWLVACLLLLLGASGASSVTFRWASSSYRIYVTGPGSVTLSDIKAALPKAPLVQVAPAVWHLRANLQIEKGAKLVLYGTRLGGDVNELRLRSNNSLASNSIVYISADWGAIDIRSTAIASWDDAVNGPDTEYTAFGRAYIRVRSSLDADGVTPHESRMDVIDSDIGYLGSHESEAYGLVWKVVGFHGDLGLYDRVNVYGDIIRSHLHHNYFGMYTYGAYGMRLLDNESDHNVAYGFDPHDDSDFLVIEGNNVHHNGTHGIIASQRCDHLTVRNNISWANGGNGIMLHRSTDDALVENNFCLHNGDHGIAIFDSRRNLIRQNTCWHNFAGGIRLSVGSADNLVEDNEFAYSGNYGFYLYRGTDAPLPGDNGRPKRNRFVNNLVHHNAGEGIFLTGSDDNLFTGNLFEANVGPLWFINGRRNRLDSNSIPVEAVVRTQGSPSFASTTFINNQATVRIQVDAYSATIFEDRWGRVFDPEEGGIANTINPLGSKLTLTPVEIGKTSTVNTRNLQVVPDAGNVLVAIAIWNLSGDLSKDWLVQAGSLTHAASYRVGNLAPGTQYDVFKNGVATRFTADATGAISFQDQAVMTGVTAYAVRPHL